MDFVSKMVVGIMRNRMVLVRYDPKNTDRLEVDCFDALGYKRDLYGCSPREVFAVAKVLESLVGSPLFQGTYSDAWIIDVARRLRQAAYEGQILSVGQKNVNQ